jgi:hypothetical protein
MKLPTKPTIAWAYFYHKGKYMNIVWKKPTKDEIRCSEQYGCKVRKISIKIIKSA